jgi:hypothetical protein
VPAVRISVRNRGAQITSTSYWRSEQAGGGFLFLTFNVATLRILVPTTAVALFDDLPPGGTPSTSPARSSIARQVEIETGLTICDFCAPLSPSPAPPLA